MSIREINNKIKFHKEEIKKLEEMKRFEETEEVLMNMIYQQTLDIQAVGRGSLKTAKKYIPKTFKMVIVRKGRMIICTITSMSSPWLKGVGVANCSPEDEFDARTGSKIAEMRAKSDFYRMISERMIDKL